MAKETNFSYVKNIARADAICINSIEDLLVATTYIDADNRQLFPMQHYWVNQSIEVPFSVVKFGQNEMFSDTILAEDWVYTGSGTAFKRDLYLTESIASFSSEDAGSKTRVNLTNMCVAWKQAITISGTVNYDGDYTVPFGTDRKTGDTSFVIDAAFAGTEAGTATITNIQFVVQRLNLYADNGSLFDVRDQSLFYMIDSYAQADSLGITGGLDYRFINNDIGDFVTGMTICDCGDVLNISGNIIRSGLAGNSYFFDLETFDPQFSQITVDKNTLYPQATDNFIRSSSEAHKNLTENGLAIITENVSNTVITTPITTITKADYNWNFFRNNTPFSFKDTQRIGDFHVGANTKKTPIGGLGTWYDLDLDAGAVVSSVIEGFSLIDTTKGILKYDAKNTISGNITPNIVCETTAANSKIYQFRVLKNGSIHVEDIISKVEVFNATRTLTMVVPVELKTNDTFQIQVLELSGVVTDITITNITTIFR